MQKKIDLPEIIATNNRGMDNNTPLIEYTPANVRALIDTGHTKTETAKLTGKSRQAIWAMSKKLSLQKEETLNLIKLLPDLFIDNIKLGKEVLSKTLEFVADMDKLDYIGLPNSAKIGFGNLALLTQTHAFNNYRLQTGQSTANVAHTVLSLDQYRLDSGDHKPAGRDNSKSEMEQSLEKRDKTGTNKSNE